jgi:hypothetical protein
MQLESCLILSEKHEILFSCECIPPNRNWNEYVDRLVKLIPDPTCEKGFYLYDDLAIGVSDFNHMHIVVTAPVTSNLTVQPIMKDAIDQIKKIVGLVCKDDCTPQNLLNRNHYISLQILIQTEISATGHMRFLSQSELEAAAAF